MSRKFIAASAVLLISGLAACWLRPAPLRYRPDQTPATAADVRREFLHAWNGYKKYAWGHDAVRPLSATARDWYRHPLLMTPVDAYDTMVIMGLTAEAAAAKDLIKTRLSFDRDMEVQHFEVNIRILGGLLSAYELDPDPRFLALARELADRMLPVFDSPTGMPYRYINLKTGKVSGRVSGPAEAGTYVLEYGTLSRLTGDPKYFAKARRAALAVHQRRSGLGLVGLGIDVESGKWVSTDASVGGGIDSYYEYLLKGALLFDDPELLRAWQESIAAVNAHLAEEAGGLWYGHADMNSGRMVAPVFGSLDAFFPALLALGGDRDRAARLQDSCLRMWNVAGIEPERLDYRRMAVLLGNYPLRPEIVESAYYLYHYTGDEKYRRMGYGFWNALRARCRVTNGYAGMVDVRAGLLDDGMESFFFAETLKYFYLLFSPPDAFDFEAVIFNTEAHPLKKP